jgi:hypothetical protein
MVPRLWLASAWFTVDGSNTSYKKQIRANDDWLLETILLITFLICRTIWKDILILFFRERSTCMWPKSVLLSNIPEIVYVTSKKIRTDVESLPFPFKSGLNIKETAATMYENYPLSKSSLNNEILLTYLLTYEAEPFLRSCQFCSHSGNSQ